MEGHAKGSATAWLLLFRKLFATRNYQVLILDNPAFVRFSSDPPDANSRHRKRLRSKTVCRTRSRSTYSEIIPIVPSHVSTN